jgi:hypothetical protein
MTIIMKKTLSKLLAGLFLLTFLFAACNNKGGDKKETTTDTPVIKPVESVTPAPAPVQEKPTDSLAQKPVKTPD